jgi:hypothetical protein
MVCIQSTLHYSPERIARQSDSEHSKQDVAEGLQQQSDERALRSSRALKVDRGQGGEYANRSVHDCFRGVAQPCGRHDPDPCRFGNQRGFA